MKFFSRVKTKSIKVGKGLFGYNQIKGGTEENYAMFSKIFKENLTKHESESEETYITKQQVLEAKKGFSRLVVLFLFLFVIALLYTLGNLIRHNFVVGGLGFIFSLLCLVFAFRYHFWLYQIKNQVLGASFSDYYQAELKGFFRKQKSNSNKDRS